jgi:hypothetical protein
MTKEEALRGIVFYGFDVKIEVKHHYGGHWTTEFKGTFDSKQEFDEVFVRHCTDQNCVSVDVMDARDIIKSLADNGEFERIAKVAECVEDGEVAYVEGFGHVDHQTYMKPSEAPDMAEVCWAWFGHDYQGTHMTVRARAGSLDCPDFEFLLDDVDLDSETAGSIKDAAAEELRAEKAAEHEEATK